MDVVGQETLLTDLFPRPEWFDALPPRQQADLATLAALRSFHCVLAMVAQGKRLLSENVTLGTVRDALFIAVRPKGIARQFPNGSITHDDGLNAILGFSPTLEMSWLAGESALEHASIAVGTGDTHAAWNAVGRSAVAMAAFICAHHVTDGKRSLLDTARAVFTELSLTAQTDADDLHRMDFRAVLQAPLLMNPTLKGWAQVSLNLSRQGYAGTDATADPWTFWRDWYQGFLDGRPMDWELQRRVAMIPDDDWQQGPAHIAALIADLQAAYLAEKAPLAETIAVNPATGLFYATPIPVQNPPLIGALIARVADALDDAARGANGLHPDAREVRVLRRALGQYGNDPQRLEMDFTSIAIGLRRQIHDTEELPQSEDNHALLEAVEEAARGLRASHPDVAANRKILAAQALREMTPADKATLANAAPVLASQSEGVMASDFVADIAALVNDATLPAPDFGPRLPGAEPATRVFGRVAKMRMLTRAGANLGAHIQAIDAHPATKAVKIGKTGFDLISFLNWLVQLGLKLFGVI